MPFAMKFWLHPWDIDRLTIGQFEVYAAVWDEMERQNKAAAKEQRQRKR